MSKRVSTSAEKSGIMSIKDKDKEISEAKGVPLVKKSRVKKEEPQVVYVVAQSQPQQKPTKAKRVISDEQRKILTERLVKARQAKMDKRAQA